AYEPFRYPGGVHVGGVDFWVHAWPLNYAELDIEDLRSPAELCEVAYDSGVQLGRGHPKRWAAREVLELRRRLLAGLPKERMARAAGELAAPTQAGWDAFPAAPAWPGRLPRLRSPAEMGRP